MSDISGTEFAEKTWKSLIDQKRTWDQFLEGIRITAAGNGSCTAEFIVEEDLTNIFGTLHGGCIATIIDCVSTLGLITVSPSHPGVSINLCVNYESAPLVGVLIEVYSNTVKCGRNLAFLEAVLKEKESGKIIATASHLKYVGVVSTMAVVSGPEAVKLAGRVWKAMTAGNGFERTLQKVTITAAGNGSCTAEFKVEEGFTNKNGTLHGGCTATLIDCISSIGLLTAMPPDPGVSVNLSINYMSAAPMGATVELVTNTVKSGKTLAFLDAVLKIKDTGKVIATGTHVKFVAK